jgi:hypothetical protein
MALPNSLDKVNRKIFTFFNETESNRSQIQVQKNEQNLFETEVNRATPNQMAVNKIIDLSFDWKNFIIVDQTEINVSPGSFWIETIYQTWEVVIRGLTFEQLPALKHNFLFRFGQGEPLLDFELGEDDTIWSTKLIQSKELENSSNNEFTFYYGIYMDDDDIVPMNNGMQVKLQLTLFNPNLYY